MRADSKDEFKYEVWVRLLRDKIKRGELVEGDRLPSHSAMKEEHGLSRPTVERIYALLEQDGLIVREERRGAFVAKPRAQVSNTIGVFSPLGNRHEHQPYNVHLLTGIREVAEALGLEVQLLGGSVLRGERAPDWMRLGGVLALAAEDRLVDSLLDCLPPGMPCVTLIGETPRALSVSCDDYHGAMALTRHLTDLNHRRIAALIAPKSLVVRRRLEGYHQSLLNADIVAQENWIRELPRHLIGPHGFVQAAKQTMQQWLQEDWARLGCTAIMAQNDETAIGIIEALEEAGLRVPEDVSVTGFDGTELARHFRPRLTTMEAPLYEMGARGAQWLAEEMRASREGTWTFETASRETVVLLPRLLVGESTSPNSGN